MTHFNPSAFQETLSLLYQQWKIDRTMFEMIEQRLLYTDTILYGVSKFGCFSTQEIDDIRQILHRIISVQSLNENSGILKSDFSQNLLLKLLEKEKMIQGIYMLEQEFVKKVVETGESPLKPEMVTLLSIQKLLSSNVTKETVFSVSRCLSQYISSQLGENPANDDQRIGLFLEHLLQDTSLDVLLTQEIIPHKFRHLHTFLSSAFLSEEPVELEYLIKRFLSVDITEIAHSNFDRESNYLPTFNLLQPLDQDIYPTKLSYLHYVKQGRGIYASYYFFLEHLRQYSKVTTTHALLAAENVTEVALQNLHDSNLVTHCIAFIENIGIDTQKVRALIRCLKKIDHNQTTTPLNDVVHAMITKLKSSDDIDSHVVDLEALKLISDTKNHEFRNGICDVLSKERSWYKLLLISQYMNLTIEELFKIVCKIQITNIRKNLMLAIQYDKVDQLFQHRNNRHFRKRRNTYGRQKSTENAGISHFAFFMHQGHEMDLMGAVLQLTRNYNTENDETDSFKAFLRHIMADPGQEMSLINYAWQRKWPVFAVLAAVKGIDVSLQYLGIIWLATSIGYESESLRCGEFQTFDQFSAEVVSFAVKNGFTETLAVATKIFYQVSDLF